MHGHARTDIMHILASMIQSPCMSCLVYAMKCITVIILNVIFKSRDDVLQDLRICGAVRAVLKNAHFQFLALQNILKFC